jgi:very-short-patch-repair endonuclease
MGNEAPRYGHPWLSSSILAAVLGTPPELHRLVLTDLERHEQRRGQGVPTVTSLIGPPGLGLRMWRAWARWRGRPTAFSLSTDERGAAVAWIEAAANGHDLRLLAARATSRGEDPQDLVRRLDRLAGAERSLFLDRITAPLGADLARVCRLVLDTREIPPARIAEALFASAEAGVAMRTLAQLIPPETRPCLLFASVEARAPLGWLDHAAVAAARVVETNPELAVAIAADAWAASAPSSRAHALLAEGRITLPALSAEAVVSQLAREDVPAELRSSSSAERLAADGADEGLVSLFACAARAVGGEARSEAERFLHARLESLAWSAGRFELNGAPGFRFGSREAEVDLLARELKLAIEIDGYYHFQNRDAYRRDRRKDLELQRRGYLVLRVLEEDIVTRLEEILHTIEDAMRHQATSVGGTR